MVFKVPEDLKMWVKRPAGHYYLPLMFNVSAGITVNILRYPNPGVIGRHVHDGPVFSYTIEGAWYYPEHDWVRSEEHTSELQSLMRISYAVFCLKKKKEIIGNNIIQRNQK